MIPPQTPWYREALGRSHEAYARVEVWRGGVQIEELASAKGSEVDYTYRRPVFLAGSVRATLASRVTRTLNLSVPDFLYPWETTDLLSPFGNQLYAYRGVRYGDGTVDEFPVFRGPITGARPAAGGRLQVTASDRAYRVITAGLAQPEPSEKGDPLLIEMKRLIRYGYPAAEFGPCDTFTETVPELAYDGDLGESLDSLAKVASALWYTLADGRFVIRRAPWVVLPTTAPLQLIDGDGGSLLSGYPDRTVEGIYNRVTMTSERPDGGPALYATADDADPTSPTWVGGSFGIRAIQVRVTGEATQQQLLGAAKTLVRRSRARTSAWQIECVPDGSIELGDPLNVSFRGRQALQLVAGYTMPLEADDTMSIDGRDLLDTEGVL